MSYLRTQATRQNLEDRLGWKLCLVIHPNHNSDRLSPLQFGLTIRIVPNRITLALGHVKIASGRIKIASRCIGIASGHIGIASRCIGIVEGRIKIAASCCSIAPSHLNNS